MPRYTRALAAGLALVITLAACNDGGDDGGEGAVGGAFSIHNCEPQSLIPQNSTQMCGSRVLDALFSGLFESDPETFEPVPVVAESIETDDARRWEITLRDDFTFHDGTPVTAQAFVDAWNFAVDPGNAMQNSGFFANIVGFDEVQGGEAEEMAGLEAPDETTLVIELTEPFAALAAALTYTAFYPLPEIAYDDLEAFEEAPIGNGRYRMEGEWEHDRRIVTTRYGAWPGNRPGLADQITWEIYTDPDTAYLDVQRGDLDILDAAPPGRDAEQDFGDNALRRETSTFTYLGFPLYDERFDDVDLRRALSLAIDREAIIDSVFDGARVPASSLIPPVLPAHREGICDACEHDPDRARALFEQAGGWDGELTVYFNSEAGHEEWIGVVAEQWRDTLGVEDITLESVEFTRYLDLHVAREIDGPFRLGWVLTYGSPQYALEPLYATGASSNHFEYSDEEFDELVERANAELDPGRAEELYQQAEEELLADMPHIPLWYEAQTAVHSDRVTDVGLDARSFVRVERVEVLDRD
jgi:oligopeptide transport system substrate-binding protein